MAAMNQRKKLSTKGRIIATGLSIGAAGVLAGAMAITDHTASASPAPVVDAGTSDSGVSSPSAAPFTPSQPQTPAQQAPAETPTFQPHTRSGGS